MRDFDVAPFTRGEDAIAAARTQPFDLALLDLKMPGMTGEQVLEVLKSEHPDIEVIILTGHGSIDSAVKLTQAGSYSYLQKPCETDELMKVLREAYQKRVERRLQISQKRIEEMLGTAVGESPLAILRKLKKIDEGKL
jgi:DNA-binding NtrC family response regulator